MVICDDHRWLHRWGVEVPHPKLHLEHLRRQGQPLRLHKGVNTNWLSTGDIIQHFLALLGIEGRSGVKLDLEAYH